MLTEVLSPAQLVGYVAFILGVASFLQKSDRHFKLYMFGECIAYVIHFWLLGNPTAMASSSISAIRSALSLYTRSIWVAITVVIVNLALGITLVQHWWNWFPLIASCVGTLALFLLHGVRMRVVMLLGTLLWVANNIISGSIGGTALEIVILAVNSHTIWRMRRDARLAQASEAHAHKEITP
ncbi:MULTISPECIES: YgjV family protein [Uliginosibacterium]|uniref:YgjV family protein n=1 Tax=Uliginosibacterium aquaticum TaxID=2731212 RepID=A0ABX2IDV8_9RHOO|nr:MULTISPECIES: YgjV family protein [Uliginosibacterium]MDO6388011.1 YgjV family protein [Uliginosibacterium sp. 31-12]NSL54799.1 YgjV family protein [Uliginosibacterium aquaticum]PLK48149.1 YgjV family protein [Uliginosibacterium sp. TH139]